MCLKCKHWCHHSSQLPTKNFNTLSALLLLKVLDLTKACLHLNQIKCLNVNYQKFEYTFQSENVLRERRFSLVSLILDSICCTADCNSKQEPFNGIQSICYVIVHVLPDRCNFYYLLMPQCDLIYNTRLGEILDWKFGTKLNLGWNEIQTWFRI